MKYLLTLSLILGTMAAQACVNVKSDGTYTIDKWGCKKKTERKGVR
jgi:hypothetical protein